MKYGAPYMGSKSGIAEWVVSLLPPAENLYDLFAGGCAVTHCALLSGKYSHIHANDIGDAPKMFLDAVNGKYSHMTRWVSRGEFYAEKDSDPYVKWCWSFGNNGRDYMYSRKIEAAKHARRAIRRLPQVLQGAFQGKGRMDRVPQRGGPSEARLD